MEHAKPKYAVTLQEMPGAEFEKERRFIAAEKDFVRRKLAEMGNRVWPFFSYPGLNIFRPVDWKRYDHSLEKYGRELDKHEVELREEYAPFKLFVTNMSNKDASALRICVTVKNGTVSERKPPKRPRRIDAAGSSEKTGFAFPRPDGFVRSGIKITPHKIEANFSKLKAHDGADLVRKVLYLHGGENTRIYYEIQSKGPDLVERGEVEL